MGTLKPEDLRAHTGIIEQSPRIKHLRYKHLWKHFKFPAFLGFLKTSSDLRILECQTWDDL